MKREAASKIGQRVGIELAGAEIRGIDSGNATTAGSDVAHCGAAGSHVPRIFDLQVRTLQGRIREQVGTYLCTTAPRLCLDDDQGAPTSGQEHSPSLSVEGRRR